MDHVPARVLTETPVGAVVAPPTLPPYIPPPGAFIGTASDDVFVATADPDVFVFDAQAVNQNDQIIGFDTTEDLIVFINATEADIATSFIHTFFSSADGLGFAYGANGNQLHLNDPNVGYPDYLADYEVHFVPGLNFSMNGGFSVYGF